MSVRVRPLPPNNKGVIIATNEHKIKKNSIIRLKTWDEIKKEYNFPGEEWVKERLKYWIDKGKKYNV